MSVVEETALSTIFIKAILPHYEYRNLYMFDKSKDKSQVKSFNDIYEHHKQTSYVIYLISDIQSGINSLYARCMPLNVDIFETHIECLFSEEIDSIYIFIRKLLYVKHLLENPYKFRLIKLDTMITKR